MKTTASIFSLCLYVLYPQAGRRLEAHCRFQQRLFRYGLFEESATAEFARIILQEG